MSEYEQQTHTMNLAESPCDHQLERPRVELQLCIVDDDDIDDAYICRGID